MDVSVKREDDFRPIELTIVIKTKEELKELFARMALIDSDLNKMLKGRNSEYRMFTENGIKKFNDDLVSTLYSKLYQVLQPS